MLLGDDSLTDFETLWYTVKPREKQLYDNKQGEL